MRKKITLAALAIGLGAAVLPVTSASAACVPVWWETVTGDCSPCQTAGPAIQALRERGQEHGIDPEVQCVA